MLKDTFKVAVEPQPLFEPKYPKPLVAAEFAVHEVANFGETPSAVMRHWNCECVWFWMDRSWVLNSSQSGWYAARATTPNVVESKRMGRTAIPRRPAGRGTFPERPGQPAV